jgi:hypothetical protein
VRQTDRLDTEGCRYSTDNIQGAADTGQISHRMHRFDKDYIQDAVAIKQMKYKGNTGQARYRMV